MLSDTIVVAGATGYVGRHVVAALAAQGHRMRALVRSRERAESPGAFGAPSLQGCVAEWRIVDYSHNETLENVCQNASRIVSALGVTRQNASPWDIDFLGNLRLLQDAERHELEAFFYVNVVHCDRGTSLTMRSKHAFVESLRRSQVAAQIVNPSGYFSDMTDFLAMARKGFGFTVDGGRTKINPIHGADLAAFIVEHLTEPSGSWDVGGPDIFSYRELEELAFKVAGRQPHILRLRPGTLRPVQWISDRSSPHIGNLTRFFIESLQTDAVGTPLAGQRLEPYLRAL